MSDEDERLKNLIIFKIPMTDKELGLDKGFPPVLTYALIGIMAVVFIIVLVGVLR